MWLSVPQWSHRHTRQLLTPHIPCVPWAPCSAEGGKWPRGDHNPWLPAGRSENSRGRGRRTFGWHSRERRCSSFEPTSQPASWVQWRRCSRSQNRTGLKGRSTWAYGGLGLAQWWRQSQRWCSEWTSRGTGRRRRAAAGARPELRSRGRQTLWLQSHLHTPWRLYHQRSAPDGEGRGRDPYTLERRGRPTAMLHALPGFSSKLATPPPASCLSKKWKFQVKGLHPRRCLHSSSDNTAPTFLNSWQITVSATQFFSEGLSSLRENSVFLEDSGQLLPLPSLPRSCLSPMSSPRCPLMADWSSYV